MYKPFNANTNAQRRRRYSGKGIKQAKHKKKRATFNAAATTPQGRRAACSRPVNAAKAEQTANTPKKANKGRKQAEKRKEKTQ